MEFQYSALEEKLNTLTHGIGLGAAVVGLVGLVAMGIIYGEGLQITSLTIYGISLVALYLCSTLYHGVKKETVKRKLKILDHSSIYLLIAGTYTPFTLVSLKGIWGWTIFGIVWGLAVVGITLKLFFTGRYKVLSTLFYVFMGWLVVFAIKPLVAALPLNGLVLLVAGGLAYTLGTVFYINKKRAYTHAIWHLFVLAGSTLHYFAVIYSVLPLNI